MTSTQQREQWLGSASKIVIKMGTAMLTDQIGRLDVALLGQMASQVAQIRTRGLDVTLVVSGAIGAGIAALQLPGRPHTLPQLQGTAAVGQSRMMGYLHDAFAPHDLHVAQMLLTRNDFEDRRCYLNIRNTIAALHTLSAIPVINENDTIAVDELRFGDNDIIAAQVTNLLRADVLIILTVVNGLAKDGKTLEIVEQFDPSIMQLADGSSSRLGSGGMLTKLEAAQQVVSAGEVAVIANGKTPEILPRLLDGEVLGTLFVPSSKKLNSRKRWIGMTVRPTGTIFIDPGAAKALANGKSLLATGITSIRGQFKRGDVVSVVDRQQSEIARGLTNYDFADLDLIKGLRSERIVELLGDNIYEEVIHRDHLVVK